MSKSFGDLVEQVTKCEKKTVSVCCAQDDAVLEAVRAAKEKGIVDAILVVDDAKAASAQKEARIIDTLEPVMMRHKLIVDKQVIEDDYKVYEKNSQQK